jgi:hypothetical protein
MTVNRTSIGCSASPGRAFMGILPTLFHEVSGQLFVKDNKTIIIRDFNYDGLGPGRGTPIMTHAHPHTHTPYRHTIIDRHTHTYTHTHNHTKIILYTRHTVTHVHVHTV